MATSIFLVPERFNGGPLFVTEVRPDRAEDERTVPPILEAPYTVYYRSLAELVKNPRFVFEVSAVAGKVPKERVRVTFTYDWNGEKVPPSEKGGLNCVRERIGRSMSFRLNSRVEIS